MLPQVEYALAGAAAATAAAVSSLRSYLPPSSFVPPAAAAARVRLLPSTTTATEDAARKGLLCQVPNRSLLSPWLSFDRRRDMEEKEEEEQPRQRSATTQTLHAPFESFARTERGTAAAAAAVHFGTEHGLLCLERAMPDELLRGLGALADAAGPFKEEALLSSRGGGEEEWLDTLTDPFIAAGNNVPCYFSPKNSQQKEQGGGDVEGQRANPRWERLPSPNDQNNGGMQDSESIEALRWLKADVKRIARVFAREISSDPGCEGVTSGKQDGGEGGEGEGGIIDVTVKLELLRKGKCPRFHLDKVPLRLICTYVGPTTEWLDGYDTWEMEHNRSLPPACNAGISGGREARHAKAGDVLIFRGQQGGQGQDAVGVAHRSPDMVEGQRRLVLTMDVGDIIAASPLS